MAISKKYIHDHLVLLLVSINLFLALGGSIFILLRLGSGHGATYIVQCRDCSNPAALNKFTTGNVIDVLSFVVFAALVMVSNTILSMRAYHIHRQLAISVLGLGTLLLAMTIIVSNALLALR
ncbi:MAG TPA: hypothetical protein VHB51_00365 [Candidatus Saccharimonadales bacterium]|nr:hypothetical protein [Candidatus Saccharimonadales bacterium]